MAYQIQIYQTRDGDKLDRILWRHYGAESPSLEIVLEANPGLAELIHEPFVSGVEITLPEIQINAVAEVARLWE